MAEIMGEPCGFNGIWIKSAESVDHLPAFVAAAISLVDDQRDTFPDLRNL